MYWRGGYKYWRGDVGIEQKVRRYRKGRVPERPWGILEGLRGHFGWKGFCIEEVLCIRGGRYSREVLEVDGKLRVESFYNCCVL